MSEYTNYDITPYLPLINKHFPEQITLKDGQPITRKVHTNNTPKDLEDSNYKSYIQLVDANIGTYYDKIDGPDWQEDKLEEMKHDKLVYISYHLEDGELVSFISFVLTFDDFELSKIFYLYEIHVSQDYQCNKLGSKLIDAFHSLTDSHDDNMMIDKIETFKLTVFTDNVKALNWYLKLGYKISPESPTDRVLRSGKVIKPDFYILVKHTSSLMLTRD